MHGDPQGRITSYNVCYTKLLRSVRRGTTALSAAGKIHSDLEKGFIRAEVIECEEFFRFGSLSNAKAEGALRLEGKEYPVRDGEILHVRFNV